MDYECESGAKRNFEPWRQQGGDQQETEEERLDRLEAEEAEKDAMGELEGKMVDAKREMQIADALDEIRTRNERNEQAVKEGDASAAVKDERDLERERQEREDEELARKAFEAEDGVKVRRLVEDTGDVEDEGLPKIETSTEAKDREAMPPPTFKRGVKRKKDFGAALGIKKKTALV